LIDGAFWAGKNAPARTTECQKFDIGQNRLSALLAERLIASSVIYLAKRARVFARFGELLCCGSN
jgi:hypothetical protein